MLELIMEQVDDEGQSARKGSQCGSAFVLVVDAQRSMRSVLLHELRDAGYHVEAVADVETAIALLESDAFDIVLTRLLGLTPVNGFELVRRVKRRWPETAVVAMTAVGGCDTERVVEARELGAADAILLPFCIAELLQVLKRVLAERSLSRHVQSMADASRDSCSLGSVLAASRPMAGVLSEIAELTASDAHVLITGERGTGKGWVARAIRANSRRRERPFAGLNCAGVGETRLRAKLFGQLRGAGSCRGLFRDLLGGTLHLARISQTPSSTLAELRRVLERGEYQREGDERRWKADVQVLATARRPLPDSLWSGSKMVRVHMPPLRERREEIPHWVDHFLNELATEQDGPPIRLGDGVLEALVQRDYPCNLSELRGTLQHLARYARRGVIEMNVLRSLAP
jgi:DNA-binding NtrC family response regulator